MTTTSTSAPSAASRNEPLRLEHDGFPERLTIVFHDHHRTVVEVDLEPGGGTPMHVHPHYAEHFEVLDGRLEIGLTDESVHLAAGERFTAPATVPHRFVNSSEAPVRFRVELRPGHRGFVEMQLAFFGLRADGRTTPDGAPRDPRHVAIVFGWSATAPAGSMSEIAMRVLRLVARVTGEERRLRERYVAPAEGRIAAVPHVPST